MCYFSLARYCKRPECRVLIDGPTRQWSNVVPGTSRACPGPCDGRAHHGHMTYSNPIRPPPNHPTGHYPKPFIKFCSENCTIIARKESRSRAKATYVAKMKAAGDPAKVEAIHSQLRQAASDPWTAPQNPQAARIREFAWINSQDQHQATQGSPSTEVPGASQAHDKQQQQAPETTIVHSPFPEYPNPLFQRRRQAESAAATSSHTQLDPNEYQPLPPALPTRLNSGGQASQLPNVPANNQPGDLETIQQAPDQPQVIPGGNSPSPPSRTSTSTWLNSVLNDPSK